MNIAKAIRFLFIGILGLALAFMGVRGLVISNVKAPIDLYDPYLDWANLKNGDHIVMDIDFLAGQYMYTEEDGKEISRGYLLPELYADDEGYINIGYCVGVVAGQDAFTNFEKLQDESYDWWENEDAPWPTNVIHVDGYLRKMDSQERKFAIETLEEYGFDQADDRVIPFMIMQSQSNLAYIGMTALGLIIALVGGIFVVVSVKN